MAGAILSLAAALPSRSPSTGSRCLGILFPVGFIPFYLLGFDLLTGVFTLCPLALIDKRPGVTMGGILRNWGLVFCGNFGGALTVAIMMAIIWTFGFTEAPNAVAQKIGTIGEGRTVGYSAHGGCRHADAVHPRRAVQLDGVHRRRLRHDLHQRDRQGRRHVDADHGLLSTWASSTPSSTCSSSRPA